SPPPTLFPYTTLFRSQACFTMTWLLNPANGWRFFSYISHKLLRWFVPHLMLVALLSDLMLLEQGIYCVLLALQVTFYALALYGRSEEHTSELQSRENL